LSFISAAYYAVRPGIPPMAASEGGATLWT